MQTRRILSEVSQVCLFAFSVSLILFTLHQPFRAHAQARSDWEIIETCTSGLTYPIFPRNQWTFEGVIFSENREGIRAIRTDVDTSYFVALEGQSSFAKAGAFSPDGRWYAYPVGQTQYGVNFSGSDAAFGVDAIQVVSTNPARTVLRLPWQHISTGTSARYSVPEVAWLDNERIVFPGGRQVDAEFQTGILNVFQDSVEQWTDLPRISELSDFSPDASRGFFYSDVASERRELYDVDHWLPIASFSTNFLRSLAWLHDSSGFFLETPPQSLGTSDELVWYDRQGMPLETIPFLESIGSITVSPQDNQLAVEANGNLYIVDLLSRQIRDLCFEIPSQGPYFRSVWSPDGDQLGFTYDGYPVLLSLDTLAMQILDYPTEALVGWYALGEEA